MTVKVYIWTRAGGSYLNYLAYVAKNRSTFANQFLDFPTSVGHASIEIDDIGFQSNIYVSHRPFLPEENGTSSSIVDDLLGQPSLPNDLTYSDECILRGEEPSYIVILEGLDEHEIINIYQAQYRRYFSYYHGLKNNCCKVVYRLVKAGLGCPLDGECGLCTASKYVSLAGKISGKTSRRNKIENVLFSMLINSLIQNRMYQFARLLLQGYEVLKFLEDDLSFEVERQNNKNIILSATQLANKLLVDAWMPSQLINFLAELDEKNIRSCEKLERQ